MILNRTNKTTLDEFLEKRGIEKNNFHLKENSILLQKILFMKRHQKNNTNYNQYFTNLTLNNFYLNQSSKRKNIFTRSLIVFIINCSIICVCFWYMSNGI